MASIHRKENSPFWHCAFYLPDGRRTLRSTGTRDRRKAMSICLEWERASQEAKDGRFTEARARETIGRIYEMAQGEIMPASTTKDYLTTWLEQKRRNLAEASFYEYENSVHELLTFLGAKAGKHMDAITLRDLTAFRDALSRRVSNATVNKILRILGGAWARALKDGVIRENLFVRIDRMKSGRAKRRAFTLDELRRVLAECDKEWRGLVLMGLYTGQRLGDLARLTWRNLDLQQWELRFTTRKTGRAMNVPLAKPLQEHLLTMQAPDEPDAPLFPKASKTAKKYVGPLSNQFYGILTAAGLVEKRSHAAQGKGRDTRRELGGLSFHCLRHTATSLLKNAGVSDVVAREIIGHESEAVSRTYTHIERDALREAMEKLPDITSGKTINQRRKNQ